MTALMPALMPALAQGSAGLALVIGLALLCIHQTSTASILLAIQSAAVALVAVALHRPLMAIPPVVLTAGIWVVRDRVNMLDPRTAPVGGANSGIVAGAVLTVLSQSQGSLALPLAIVLLSVLLAATRPHPLMRVMALVGMQNGLVLAACLVIPAKFLSPATLSGALLPLACLVLPLPLAAGLLIPAAMRQGKRAPTWLGWIDLALSLAVLAATLIVPLDSLASVFAPLLGLDGVLRSNMRRKRHALTPTNRVLALLNSVFLVLAVCAPNLTIAWFALLAAMATSLLPTLRRRGDQAVLAFLGAGITLFGLLLVSAAPSAIGYFSLFAGFATIAAVVPDLAVVSVILILRLANQGSWPPAATALGIGIALIAMLACAFLLMGQRGRQTAAPLLTRAPQGVDDGPALAMTWRGHRVTLLLLSQASIAALAIFMGQADGRFAALVLLIQLILTRSAARVTDGPVTTLAIAGLGGVPPLGVFPGLVLVVLAIDHHNAWLLLPLGAAAIPILLAGLPRRLPDISFTAAIRSIGWVPLVLALLVGYFVPDRLAHWWHILTAGRS